MTRRDFFAQTTAWLGAGAALALTRCGGGDEPSDGPAAGSCLDNGTEVTISGNHGHVLMVSKDDVAAGVDKTYDITGGATHTHMVTITAADFATLADNQSIAKTVTTPHTHNITVRCA
ncbi:MAG: hypothetical protein HYZ27_03030 [Deltaproteobacteria bacterium]|nr:hypothetical protein [Deltaproteobacteria bacterium]